MKATKVSTPAAAKELEEKLADETGYGITWWRYPDGLFLVQVFDSAGNLIDGGGGDDPEEALLEVAERLLPPESPEAD